MHPQDPLECRIGYALKSSQVTIYPIFELTVLCLFIRMASQIKYAEVIKSSTKCLIKLPLTGTD